jgi:uncharacterized protein YjiS (DUF1127 family)
MPSSINKFDLNHKLNSFYRFISRLHSKVKRWKGDSAMLLSATMRNGWNKVRLWREIARERRELRRLSEYIAKDIGISRSELEREADRPFWDYTSDRAGVSARAQKPARDRRGHCLHAG